LFFSFLLSADAGGCARREPLSKEAFCCSVLFDSLPSPLRNFGSRPSQPLFPRGSPLTRRRCSYACVWMCNPSLVHARCVLLLPRILLLFTSRPSTDSKTGLPFTLPLVPPCCSGRCRPSTPPPACLRSALSPSRERRPRSAQVGGGWVADGGGWVGGAMVRGIWEARRVHLQRGSARL
jgi:hypothetical protein